MEKDKKKITKKSSDTKKTTTKKVTTKPTKKEGIKKTTVKESKRETPKKVTKIEEIKADLIKNYDGPDADKAKDAKIVMSKKDSPKMEIIKKNRKIIIAIFTPDKIATLANGEQVIVKIGDDSITADELYTDMKEYYSVSVLLDKVDDKILTKLYPEDNDMKTSVNQTADYYVSMYETYYGYTEDQFLSSNGFADRDAFIKYLTLDYRRNQYYTDYVKGLITDDEINDYYENSVYGDISTKYISVSTSSSSDTALALANEIIEKLNNGASYDDIVSEYGDKISSEDEGYISFDNSLDSSYIEALKGLSNNTYTTTPVQGDSDYKIIFRGDQKEKAAEEDVKDKIISKLVTTKKNADSTLYYKALVNMRKENGVVFEDDDLSTKYDAYVTKNTTSTDSSTSE